MRINRPCRGMAVLDSAGKLVGSVVGTYPLDGGGPPDYAIVRGRRFGGATKLLPVTAARVHPGVLQVPYTAARIADAPEFDAEGAQRAQADHARFYWGEYADEEARRMGYRRLAALRDERPRGTALKGAGSSSP